MTEPLREPTPFESHLLRRVLAETENPQPSWLGGIQVGSMDDGGMGSLRLWSPSASNTSRCYGGILAEHSFRDLDGVLVLVKLILDQEGHPFELDLWKTNFAPLCPRP